LERVRFLKSLALLAAALAAVALALTGVALADNHGSYGGDNGGFTPAEPASPNAERINDAYYFIAIFTLGVFAIVYALLLVFVWKYRSRGRPREVEGPQVRGNTRLELLWTIVPVFILFAIGAFVLYKMPGIENAPAANDAIDVRVEGHQFYWQFEYPDGQITLDRMVVPAGRVVNMEITAPPDDVIHSWWIPALGGKRDAIPGQSNYNWFQAEREGIFKGQCGEFCGLKHSEMTAVVEAVSEEEYEAFLDQADENLGEVSYEQACGKCHGEDGRGGFGPPLRGNPLIEDADSVELVMRQGRGQMPPVSSTWSDDQVEATIEFLQAEFGRGDEE
jgi:cytochrome c oxidase subunit 2